MLVNMNYVLRYAGGKQYCIGVFDTPNLEILMAVIRAVEKREGSVTIQHAQLHGCEMPTHIIGPIVVRMTEETRVLVCVMLDHGEDLDHVRRVLDLGFPAVIYDDSSLAYEENVTMTREVMAVVKTCNTDVGTEVNIVAGYEGKTFAINGISDAYTDPELAARYVKDTGIDALAASVGAVHGFYATKPKLDFDRIMRIKELTGPPLVMHGEPGISVAGTQRAIRCGTRKINYSSYMSDAGVKAVKKLLEEKEIEYFHDLANAAAGTMEWGVLNAVPIFALE